LHLCRRW